jgi:hypothetical protein
MSKGLLDGRPGIEVYIVGEDDSGLGIPGGTIYAFRPCSFSAEYGKDT